MNFARDVVDAAPADRLALVALGRDGTRREWTFGDVAEGAARTAGALRQRGVGRGDVVLTLIGNRPEWVLTMVACFRIGAVVLPCTEQLRSKDLALRLGVARPRLIVADVRNAPALEGAGVAAESVLWVGDSATPTPTGPDTDLAGPETPGSRAASVGPFDLGELTAADPVDAVDLAPTDPCLITFTSGTSGEPKAALHGQRYLSGQRGQAEHWLDVRPGELVWCTAASGWSKSARNVFIAPWLRGAPSVLHDARFDPHERLEILRRERVRLLCMAPTEYRVIAKRAQLDALPDLRGIVAAGEALNPEVLRAWHAATGLWIRDGYGQTETGQMTGMPLNAPARPGSMGQALPGVALEIVDGQLTVDPATVPTFFLGYLGEPDGDGPAAFPAHDRAASGEPWSTGDRVHRDDEGFLYFEGRLDDVIVSSGYRIGPFEVESALIAHPAVAEAAVVAAPDEERGSVVRAVVVLRDGHAPSDALAHELQDHVKAQTAPYKYPRIVDFVPELPKTASGKIRRAALRVEVRPPLS